MRYYRLVQADHHWCLTPRELNEKDYGYDVWAYGMCKRVEEGPIPVPFEIQVNGVLADVNLTVYRAIVISSKCSVFLRNLLDSELVQFLPAEVKGAEGEWEVLNLLDGVDCLDRQRSGIEYFPEDYSQALKRGKPRSVVPLIIDPVLAQGRDLFRIADWKVAVIISEQLRVAMEKAKIKGLEYWPVTAAVE